MTQGAARARPGLARWALVLSLACLGIAADPATVPAAPEGGRDVVPHVAVYDLSLSKARRNARVAAVSGRYRFEVLDLCDGWGMRHEARMTVSYLTGDVASFGWRLGTWEAKEGTDYRFVLRRFTGDRPVEEIRGTASLQGPGGPGGVTYAEDREDTLALPSGTVFPAQQSLQLVRAARGGTLPKRWTLFDGWERSVVGVSGYLIARYAASRPARLSSPLLDRRISWRIQVGYYDLAGRSAVPEQEQEMRIYDNGIIDEFVFDYGDFSVDGTLISLDGEPRQGC